jgi:Coenzyme PQQ synthesis protein D (PqqD)
MSSVAGRYRATPDALATRVGDEIVVVHLKTDRIYVLNPTGARIWELLSAGCDRGEITERLIGEFEVSEDDVAGQLEELLASLTSEALIECAP